MRLLRLNLTNFRNYAALRWEPGARLVVVTGPNGSGKTNLLEAVSLLTPGRGLRGRLQDVARHGGGGGWAVAGRFGAVGGAGMAARAEAGWATAALDGQQPSGGPAEEPTEIGTGVAGPGEKRVFRLDGAEPRSQAELAARVAAVWLTPQMDQLFQESASGRRRFLDRLVWALEPGHAREAASHEAAMAERRRLLERGRADPAWLAGLEEQMARHVVALAASRRQFVARLNAAPAAAAAFPQARIVLEDPVAAQLAAMPALAVEDSLRAAHAARRAADAAAGTSTLGAHRADMRLEDASTGLSAAQASTGQQKAMLMGVILAHAALIAEHRGFAPLLLLDEPAVHLDRARREALFETLQALPAQALLTGTDADAFAPLRGSSAFYETGAGVLRQAG